MTNKCKELTPYVCLDYILKKYEDLAVINDCAQSPSKILQHRHAKGSNTKISPLLLMHCPGWMNIRKRGKFRKAKTSVQSCSSVLELQGHREYLSRRRPRILQNEPPRSILLHQLSTAGVGFINMYIRSKKRFSKKKKKKKKTPSYLISNCSNVRKKHSNFIS